MPARNGAVNLLTRLRSLSLRPVHDPELPEIARSVAIIMDGNGALGTATAPPDRGRATARDRARCADRRGGDRPRHRVARRLRVLDRELDAPEEEVERLMEIFAETIERELPDLVAQGVRVRFIGRRDRAPDDLQRADGGLERETKHNERLSLWIAFDYGGRAELVEAARRLVESGVDPREVDENAFVCPALRARICPIRTC